LFRWRCLAHDVGGGGFWSAQEALSDAGKHAHHRIRIEPINEQQPSKDRDEVHRLLDVWITTKADTLRVYPAAPHLVRKENESMIALVGAVGNRAVEESMPVTHRCK